MELHSFPTVSHGSITPRSRASASKSIFGVTLLPLGPADRSTTQLTLNPRYPLMLARSLYSFFMGKFDGTRMYRLRPCLTALRVLAISANPNRYLLVERHIDEYLRTHHSLAHALKSLRRAIHHEEVQGHAEYWSIVQEYVRSLLRRMNG